MPGVVNGPPGTEGAERGAASPRIGLLWGDFPWNAPPRKVGKLLSSGVVGRNVARALRTIGPAVPYTAPSQGSEEKALVSFLRSIDVLWADLYPPSEPALRLRHELNLHCRVLLYAGGTLPKAAEAMLFPWQYLLRPGDNLLLTCEADLEIWRWLTDRSRLREWVVPLPVDETVFQPRSPVDGKTIRTRHGLPPDGHLLLYVGRLNIQKNLHSLLRLLAAVRRQVPDTNLCLVGETDNIGLAEFGVSNANYLERLHTLAAKLDVTDAITVLAPLFGEDLAALYRAADVVVNASFYHRENFGLSQAEAQACGVPVVCSDWGGFKDVVRHGKTGYLMETVITRHGVRVDWATGAEHVVRLLRDENLRRQMGERAARWAGEQFFIPVFAGRLQQILATAGPDTKEREGVAYEPSDFARRYEEHKRTSGWSQLASPTGPMFQDQEYELYETMMEPYATHLGRDLPVSSFDPALLPYTPSAVQLDAEVARDLDPVWPHGRRLAAMEREVLEQVDGIRSLGAIADDLSLGTEVVAATLHALYLDGFILLRRPDPRLAAPQCYGAG